MKRAKVAALLSVAVMAILVPMTARAGLVGVRGTGTFTGVLALGGFEVYYLCDATAVGAAASTHIDDCYLRDAKTKARLDSTQQRAYPGPAAFASRVVNVKSVPEVCWVVSATFTNNQRAVASGCAASAGGSGGGSS
ncbi:MAG: hypothetical protein ACRDKS_15540, partial [Actinomycetota bacterium]